MTSHRGRGHIPVRQLAVSVAAAIAVGAGSYVTFHDDSAPVTVIPVGSVSPLPTPTPTVSPLTGVSLVRICLPSYSGFGLDCTTQDARAVVDGSAVTR